MGPDSRFVSVRDVFGRVLYRNIVYENRSAFRSVMSVIHRDGRARCTPRGPNGDIGSDDIVIVWLSDEVRTREGRDAKWRGNGL